MPNANFPSMFEELKRPHNFNSFHEGIAKFLHSKQIIANVKTVHAERIVEPNKFNERFCYWVEAEDNVFKEKISIVIRPDSNGEHRAISVIIQIGKDVEVQNEDLDKGKSLKKTVKVEKSAVMHDIRMFILEELRKKHPQPLAA